MIFFFIILQKLTNLHDPSEHGRVVHGAAVPPPLPELVLALLDAHPGALPDMRDVILVQLAQLPLALQQQRLARISSFMDCHLKTAAVGTSLIHQRFLTVVNVLDFLLVNLPETDQTADCSSAEPR